MKKRLVGLLVSLIVVAMCVSASAAGKISVTQENFYSPESIFNYNYAFCKVENIGDKPIKVNAGIFEVFDVNGDVINSSDYLSDHASYLQPGEYTYAEMLCETPEDITEMPDDYALTITGKNDKSVISYRLPVKTELKLQEDAGYYKQDNMYTEITNTTDEVIYDVSLVSALLDDQGNILYMEDKSFYNDMGIMPGSSIVVRLEIPSSFVELYEANALKPTVVDSIAYVDIDQD